MSGIGGFFQTMHGDVSAPSCCAFTHRFAFEEVSGHRVLIKSVRETLVRRQVSQVSMRVARGSASWLSSHGRGLGGDGQGSLVCCDSWGRKESDTTERLN